MDNRVNIYDKETPIYLILEEKEGLVYIIDCSSNESISLSLWDFQKNLRLKNKEVSNIYYGQIPYEFFNETENMSLEKEHLLITKTFKYFGRIKSNT